jgi:hypothetical protein
MNPSLVKKVLTTNAGTEYAVGIRPYASSRSTLNLTALETLCDTQGIAFEDMKNVHAWLYNIMSHVGDIEFPKQSKDPELEALRQYWQQANGDMAHNYELFMDVSEDVAKSISIMVKTAIGEYKASFPQMPKSVQEGRPEDPNAKGTGGKASKKKS